MISRTVLVGFVKVGVSLACLLAIWRMFSPANWSDLIARMDPMLAISAVAVLLVGQVANGYRHWAVLFGLGRALPAGRVVALASAGMFFNQVLPSGMGGDVVRVVHLQRRCGWKRSTASVLFDRISGVSLNLAVVAVLLPFYYRMPIPDQAKVAITLLAAGPLLGLAVGLLVARHAWLRRMLPRPFRLGLYGLILLRRLVRPAVLIRLALPVLGGFFPYVACFGLIGESLGGGVGPLGYLLMVPLIFIAVQIPVSFGGWGIREGAAVALMPLVGMDSGVALLTSFLFGAAVLVTSLPGLAVWLLGGLADADVRPASSIPGAS